MLGRGFEEEVPTTLRSEGSSEFQTYHHILLYREVFLENI